MTANEHGSGTGKVAVVTGGAGGMGMATARLMGRDHEVVIADVGSERLAAAERELRSAGVECRSAVCDVTDRAAVHSLATLAASIGPVSSVVHAAGISPSMAGTRAIVDVNAVGTLHVTEEFLPAMGPGSALVNVASTAGHLAIPSWTVNRAYRTALRYPDRFATQLESLASLAPKHLRPGAAYALSKHFSIWLSRHRAAEFGQRGARIVSVSPGSFDTEMGRLEMDKGAGELARRSALGRFGTVEEIARVLAFCAGPNAGYLTGTDVVVDGGSTASMSFRSAIAMARKA